MNKNSKLISITFAILVGAIAFMSFAGSAQADGPIPQYLGDDARIYGSVESACTAARAIKPPESISTWPFSKADIVSQYTGSIPASNMVGQCISSSCDPADWNLNPYNRPGLTGWTCYYEFLYDPWGYGPTKLRYPYGGVRPVCPPYLINGEQGNYRVGSGEDTCPSNPNFFASIKPKPKAQLGKCCNGVHDPIDPATGNMYYAEHDLDMQGGLSFGRSYNSLDSANTSLGTGWRHSYSRKVEVEHNVASIAVYQPTDTNNSSLYQTAALACTSGFAQLKANVPSWTGAVATYTNDVCALTKGGTPVGTLPISFAYPQLPPPRSATLGFNVTRDDGSVIWFANQGGVPVASPDVTLRLQIIAGGYRLTDANDAVEIYDSAGKLLSITRRTGLVQTLAYNTNQQLSTVTDSFGHALVLGYDAQNRLASVTDPNSAVTTFGYDTQGRLGSVTHPGNATRTYVYENVSFPFALTGLLDENNVRHSTWEYDVQGRATHTYEANGAGNGTLVYNADGSVTTTDALSAVRTFTFGRVGDRNLPTGISGSQCPTCSEGKATAYNDAGFVSSRTDYNNNVTTYLYDIARGLETSRTEASGTPSARTITTQWHANFRVPTQIDEPGKRTTFTHDAAGNVLTTTVLDTVTSTSRTSTFTYNNVGQVLTVDGPRTDVNDVTTYTYYNCSTGYQCGQVQTITDALGHVTTFNTYNAHGQPLTITDANNVLTTRTYDERQRLKSRTAAGETTNFFYYPTGLLQQVAMPDGSFLNYVYDAAHRLTEINDSLGNRMVYTLDAAGNRTAENVYDPSNALSRTHSSVFDSLSRLYQDLTASGSAAQTTTFGYDANGNQTTINAPLNRNGINAYDELNRLKQVTDADNGITQYGYNALDQLISVTDPRNLQTVYTYNALGDLTQQVSPDTGTTDNTFDSAGNLKTSKDARNKTATYSYDALNRVTQVVYPDQTLTYVYDAGVNGIGKISSVTDSSGSTSWTYTPQGRIATKTQAMGAMVKTVQYGYNTAGQLTTITTPSNKTITYGYANNQVTSMMVNSVNLLNSVLYEPFGPTSGWTWGNGTLAVRTYDTDGKLTQLDSAGFKTIGYDDAFRITSVTDQDNSANSWSYGYDTLDRLTSATGSQTQSFTFDANGNRLTQGGTSSSNFTVSPTTNRLSSVSGALSKSYLYDNAGNTTSDGSATYTYNDAGRMTSVTKSGVTTTYTYNALGQRVTKTTAGNTTYFVYDEAGHILGEYDNSGLLIQETAWMYDTPVASIRFGSCGLAVFYIHTDHLNTPRRITKRSTNEIVWRWDSDAFGTTMANENPSGLGIFTFNLRFPGMYQDQETGLMYNYYRDGYDSATGRYTQSDPIGLRGGVNTYAYVGGNPISYVDPSGLCPFCLAIPAVCAGGGCEAGLAVLGMGAVMSTPAGREAAQNAATALSEKWRSPEEQAQKDADYLAYKAWEDNRPPKGPNCDDLRKQMEFWQVSAQLRMDYTNTWYQGYYDWGHLYRIFMARAQIKKLEQRMKELGCGC
jgi:RHS repeat-associated protein